MLKHIGRRTFLRAGAWGTAAAMVGVGLDSWLLEPHRVEVVRHAMPLEHLPASLAGRTLLQISDIHVGPRVSSEYLIDAFSAALAFAPDFVAVTGDFVTNRSARELGELARVLQNLPRGRLGTVASLGNHDYGMAWHDLDVADGVTRVAGDAGVTVLRNEVRTVGGIQFLGLSDYWSTEFTSTDPGTPRGLFTPRKATRDPFVGRLDALTAIRSTAPRTPTIVLSHNPDAQDEPMWGDLRGWVLAGHTHGGQVKPPFLPPPVLPVRNRRYTAGAFDVGPGRTMYVSRGLGHLIQVRFSVRPELTLFTLQRAPQQPAR
jgi:predicted MPP superfamily phosphohydrolase